MLRIFKTAAKAAIAFPYRFRFASLGSDVKIVPPLLIEGAGKIRVADRVTLEHYAGLSVAATGEITIGAESEIRCFARLEAHDGFIRIGSRCGVNPFTLLSGYGGLTIGNDVRIGSHCAILSSTHNFELRDLTIREQGVDRRETVVEDDVWMGHGCTIVGGVRVGAGAIIGAGAVVTRDVPPGAIVTGVPGRVTGTRSGLA